MSSVLKNCLHKFPLFHTLSGQHMQKIMEYAFFRKYRKGQILFMEGDPRDRIYFLLNGYIKLVSMDDDGSSQFFLYLKPYSIFPYVGLFQDKHYRFSGEAVTDVELLYLPATQFERLIQNDPHMLIHLIRIMGDKMYELEIRIQKLTQVHATDRVRQLISLLIKDIGEKTDGGGIRIPCPLTTTDLARMAGTSRETVSHVLQEYKASGKLAIKSKIITIIDPAFFAV
ncbi:Crp/Fnr family transcriptional regulator [Thermoflavimicrobium dichotomicum]|uniref:cAMP-binding domain of CRP or a regulatory subunit of cAMP-dependent protein kinases n=1 Tax=Thermoflavimicrobium dichotomicum TaxID=46223 RepID=A0A1I3KHI7_9BACL|nr:Crp/Fnr family transcriptional regulator [Thermoflavimicrobium dichotomicum]SFI71943.1 cAMP-binding domain of CRP or a regulatory subunit of cAMP-dependent protein kinases [Thermoflavimicrobium dichotomicum]